MIDPIRAYLVQRRAGPHVIEGGLDYLVESWEKTASDVEGREERWMWEEWVNDLDGREILQDLFDNVPEGQVALPLIEEADARFKRFAIKTSKCAWGEELARERGWAPEKHWWYWTDPPTPYLLGSGPGGLLTVEEIVPGHDLAVTAVGADEHAIRVEYEIRPHLHEASHFAFFSAVDDLGNEYEEQGGAYGVSKDGSHTEGLRDLVPLPQADANAIDLQISEDAYAKKPSRASMRFELPLPYLRG